MPPKVLQNMSVSSERKSSPSRRRSTTSSSTSCHDPRCKCRNKTKVEDEDVKVLEGVQAHIARFNVDLTVSKEIGSGAFGRVFRGTFNGQSAAIKVESKEEMAQHRHFE